MPNGVMIIDKANLGVSFINKQMEKLLGSERGEVKGPD
jgi:hypothetical protein